MLLVINNCSFSVLQMQTVTFWRNLSRRIQLLLFPDCLQHVCFLVSDHSIFPLLLHFPLGKYRKSTLGQVVFYLFSSEEKSIGKTLSRQWDIDTEKKENSHKSIPIQVNVGSSGKRGIVLLPECLVVKETRHLSPLFSYLAHLLRSFAYKSQ